MVHVLGAHHYDTANPSKVTTIREDPGETLLFTLAFSTFLIAVGVLLYNYNLRWFFYPGLFFASLVATLVASKFITQKIPSQKGPLGGANLD